MIRVLIIIGIATWYGGPAQPEYVGRPLYCGGIYDERETLPWVALDVAWFESGAVECGDEIEIRFPDGERVNVRALDAGPFGLYYIEGYRDRPIIADLPAHLWPLPGLLSAPVALINLTALDAILGESLSDAWR